MVRFLSSQRFLAAYSGILTVVFLFTVLSGFARVGPKTTFDEITVHRINIVEPDGTIRMVLTNKASAPGAYIKNKEYAHPSRKSAGMLFFDDEGTEDGGLIYGISKDANGNVTDNNVHLSFDQYMQDQIFTVDAGREGGKQYSLVTMGERGNYLILEALEANERISKLPEEQQKSEWKKFRAMHPGDSPRVVVGRDTDGSSILKLKDAVGHDRIALRVAPDGTAKLQFLDAQGNVTSELPGSPGSSPSHP
jgi:hypothetical protein